MRAEGPRRLLAMFCMALCLALSAQMTVAMLDRLQHALDIDHAPNVLAGAIDHHDDHDHDHVTGHGHDDDVAADEGDKPLGHHHQGDGMLAPWLASTIFTFAGLRAPEASYRYSATLRVDVADRRLDRPPKSLEHLA